ncbi:hypothetical protein BGZ70_003676 [Mortierella alpina]|uniref:DM2 domain-containing protein n=1 Tax=Mortierella alpina TaxID=64518 RepID=A0A9P6IS33_MORAP|nr:hypothetical protein BGZ70_003676 [Mortierella alpina]
MSVEIYRAKVTELISQADITTVSARKIRKQIEAFTNSSLDHVKRDFDDMVMEIYEKITDDIERAVLNGTQAPGAQPHHPQPQQQHHQQQHQQQQQQHPQTGFVSGFALPPTSYVPPPLPPPVAAPAPAPSTSDESEDDDSDSDASEASYSSLDEETGRKRKKPQLVKHKAAAKAQAKKKKESLAAAAKKSKDKGKKEKKKAEEKANKPKVKRKQAMNEDGTPKVNPFNRPLVISDKLAEVIGQAGSIGPSGRIEMSRPEVVKQLWVYIKANSLQLENDKRVIACDEKLKTLFGQEQVNCFSMNKYLSNHLSKAEELV